MKKNLLNYFAYSLAMSVWLCYPLQSIAQEQKPQILYIGSWTSATPYLETAENRLPHQLSQALIAEGYDHELIDVSQPYFQIELHQQDYVHKGLGMAIRGRYSGDLDWPSSYVDNDFIHKVKTGEINPDWVFIEGGIRDLNLGRFNRYVADLILLNIPQARNKKVNAVFLGIAPPHNVAQATIESVRIMAKTPFVSKDYVENTARAINDLNLYFEELGKTHTYKQNSDVPIEDRRVLFVVNTLDGLNPQSDFQLPSQEALDIVLRDDFYPDDIKKFEKFKNKKSVQEAQKELEKAPFVLSPSGMEKAVENVVQSLKEQRFFEVSEYYKSVNQDN